MEIRIYILSDSLVYELFSEHGFKEPTAEFLLTIQNNPTVYQREVEVFVEASEKMGRVFSTSGFAFNFNSDELFSTNTDSMLILEQTKH